MITSRDGRWFRRMQDRVRHLKTELVAIGLSLKDPRTPWYAKTVAAVVVVAIWLVLALLVVRWIVRASRGGD